MTKQRKLAVSGQFYPEGITELEEYINHFNDLLKSNSVDMNKCINPRAIIVPHAGYIYSGFTANIAYRYIPKNVKNIIVIGPSHKYRFEGASVAMYQEYPTPLGELPIDIIQSQQLINKYPFMNFTDHVHCEHSTETQFPFIKHYMPNANVVEVVYSNIDPLELSNMITWLLEDTDNFIVVSTDLSHFHTYEEALSKDSICLNAIQKNSIASMDKGCEACGILGVKAILDVASNLKLKSTILDYRTSADTSNDKNSVVGYVSAVIGR